MRNGGYKIIDLHDVNLVTGASAVTIKGTHEAIEHSYRKPLLLSGLVIDGVEKNDVFIEVSPSSTSYTISAYNKTITVTSADKVSIA